MESRTVTTKAIPSFQKQTEWATGYFGLPVQPEVRWFNPSICEFKGKRWLCVRRADNHPPPFGMNTLVLFRLEGTKAVEMFPIRFLLTTTKEHYEDPRLVVLSGHLFVSATNFNLHKYNAHQVLARLSVMGPYAEAVHPVYGYNGKDMASNTGNEKNWTWFEHKDGWHFVYAPWPHHVVRTNYGEAAATYEAESSQSLWSYGLMRGGSPPVLFDGLYWSFFHSSIDGPKDWRKQGVPRRRYYMGAYAFDPDPPFKPRLITPEPLLVGSEEDGGGLPVVFPGGAIRENDNWLVALGINDFRSGWIRVPHDSLVDKTVNI